MIERIENHKIMSLDEGKRNRIINSAMKEFNKGYKKATTDAIVKEAGISKGLLFHYFGSKEKLYEFTLVYAADVAVNEYFGVINFEQPDILERLWQALLLKMDLSYKYPMMFDFLTTAYKENVNGKIMDWYKRVIGEVMPRLMSNIDYGLFRDDIDPQVAIKVIQWTQMGYANTQFDTINSTDIEDYKKQYDKFLKDVEEYFSLFRKVFYKTKTEEKNHGESNS